MLINLSNHPQIEWGKKQLQFTQQQYGRVIDILFPQISAKATSAQVQELAEQMVKQIGDEYGNKDVAVPIMGELTFVHKVVLLFKENNIRCVASTTERKVEIKK
jgi:hypothetical protein